MSQETIETTERTTTQEANDDTPRFELKLERDGEKARGYQRLNGNVGDIITMVASTLDDHDELFEILREAVKLVALKKLFGFKDVNSIGDVKEGE